MDNDGFATGFLAGQDNSNGGGFGGLGDGWLGLILFAMIFGWGNGGFGGFDGGGAGGALTRAELYDGFAIQNIDSAVRGVQQGICDSTYALNNAITGGFHGVDNAICTLGYQTQQGFNTLGYALKDCCCETQRLIERGFCDIGNAVNMQTRDIIDNQNANYRGIMDFLVTEKLAAKDAQIAQLQGALGRAEDRSYYAANQEAQTAELIRRLKTPEAVPAFVVPNPNCCYGNPVGVGYPGTGYGGTGYTGTGCGCC